MIDYETYLNNTTQKVVDESGTYTITTTPSAKTLWVYPVLKEETTRVISTTDKGDWFEFVVDDEPRPKPTTTLDPKSMERAIDF